MSNIIKGDNNIGNLDSKTLLIKYKRWEIF